MAKGKKKRVETHLYPGKEWVGCRIKEKRKIEKKKRENATGVSRQECKRRAKATRVSSQECKKRAKATRVAVQRCRSKEKPKLQLLGG